MHMAVGPSSSTINGYIRLSIVYTRHVLGWWLLVLVFCSAYYYLYVQFRIRLSPEEVLALSTEVSVIQYT